MRRRWVVAFALVMAAMLAWAPGSVAAGHGLVVASQHTTTSEFNNAQTLTNLTVSKDAVRLQPSLLDGFEDKDITEYTGDTGSYTVQATTTIDAGQTLRGGGSGAAVIQSTSGLHDYPDPGETTRFQFQASEATGSQGLFIAANGTTESGYLLQAYHVGDEIRIFRADSGSYTQLNATSVPLEPGTTYTGVVKWETDGTITFTIKNSTGTMATITATDTNYTDGGIGFRYDGGGSSTSNYYFDNVTLDTARTPATAQYISPLHSVSDSEAATINITAARNVSVDATVRTDGGTVLNSTTLTTTGNHTLTYAEASSSSIEVVLNVTTTDSDAAFSLGDDSILFTPAAPTASNLKPADGTKLSQSSVDFSVDVNDTDFRTGQGDSVDATLYVDGTRRGTKTVTSNGTVTITETLSEGGDHTFHWEMQDSYGESTTTATKNISVPSELRIYNESAPTELVDNVSVEIRFYFDDGDPETIVTRTTTNGTLNMTGLPADEPFVVVAEAENYTSRRIFVPSLYETQTVYLLPSSKASVDTVFSIEDYTGDYPEGVTVLEVQRALTRDYDGDGDNETRWQTVLGDYFGANAEFPAQVRQGARHRLVLRNTETGQSTTLGTYTPLGSETQTVTVSPSGILETFERPPVAFYQPGVGTLPAQNDMNVTVELDNRSLTLSSWNVTMTYVNTTSETNTTLYSASSSDSGGTKTATLDLANATGKLVVEVEYETSGGLTGSLSRTYRIQEIYGQYESNSLLAIATNALPALVPEGNWGIFSTMLAVLLTVFFTAAFAYTTQAGTEIVGGVAIALLAGFSLIEFVSYDVVFASTVAWVAMAAMRRRL